jgi:hypothetical protein
VEELTAALKDSEAVALQRDSYRAALARELDSKALALEAAEDNALETDRKTSSLAQEVDALTTQLEAKSEALERAKAEVAAGNQSSHYNATYNPSMYLLDYFFILWYNLYTTSCTCTCTFNALVEYTEPQLKLRRN